MNPRADRFLGVVWSVCRGTRTAPTSEGQWAGRRYAQRAVGNLSVY